MLDLGCGNGRYTLLSALARPELNHIGVDVLPVVIRYATRRANHRGLHHVRFAVKDAQTFLSGYVGSASLAEVHLYHPQPYHDPRMAHRRLVTPRFLADLHRGLTAGGRFVVQTDNPDYWAYIRAIATVFFDFREHPGPWPDAPEGRSRREILARSRARRFSGGSASVVTTSPPMRLFPWRNPFPSRTFRLEGPGAISIPSNPPARFPNGEAATGADLAQIADPDPRQSFRTNGRSEAHHSQERGEPSRPSWSGGPLPEILIKFAPWHETLYRDRQNHRDFRRP